MPPEPDELTDAAKAEIAAAVKIVAEDRHEKFMREWRESQKPKTDPPVDPPADPPVDPPTDPDPNKPTPPPAKPPTPDPPVKKKRSLYWGDEVE